MGCEATHSTTKFGIELDSLSDLVAFGVAPAVMMYKWALAPFGRIGWAAAFLFMACGALRLARYNVQMGSRESKAFTGMPIPGAAAIAASLVLFHYEIWGIRVRTRTGIHSPMMVLLAFLMVSTLRYHGAKEIDFKNRKPFWILVAFILVLMIIITHPSVSLFILAMVYCYLVVLQKIYSFFIKKRRTQLRKVLQDEDRSEYSTQHSGTESSHRGHP